MAAGDQNLGITAILAFSHGVPRVGEEFLIATSKLEAMGKIRSLAIQPSHSSVGLSASPSLWVPPSRMALVDIGVARPSIDEPLERDTAQLISLWHPASREPVGDGLTVPFNSRNAGRSSGALSVPGGFTIWTTGLSGAGKTTIARELHRRLYSHFRVEILDADVVRTHICKRLGFTEEDRMENVWRLALTASMLAETGAIVLVSAISPYRTAREEARRRIGRFIEVYVNAPLSVCESRDVKGLYKRARDGEIQRFTGIDDPYEPPLDPEVECHTEIESISESVEKIMAVIESECKPWLGSASAFANETKPHEY
jgi:adenylyl-sulfate kinase